MHSTILCILFWFLDIYLTGYSILDSDEENTVKIVKRHWIY